VVRLPGQRRSQRRVPFSNSGHGTSSAPVRKNDFGFSIGGPASIPKFTTPRTRPSSSSPGVLQGASLHFGVQQTLPTTQMRAGDFSQILTGATSAATLRGRPFSKMWSTIRPRRTQSTAMSLPSFPAISYPEPDQPHIGENEALFQRSPTRSGQQLAADLPGPQFMWSHFEIRRAFGKQHLSFYYSEFPHRSSTSIRRLPAPSPNCAFSTSATVPCG